MFGTGRPSSNDSTSLDARAMDQTQPEPTDGMKMSPPSSRSTKDSTVMFAA